MPSFPGSFLVVSMATMPWILSACSDRPALPEAPPEPQASELRQAVQNPIDATNRARSQVEDTQQRTQETLDHLQ